MSGTPVSKEVHYRIRTDSGGIDAAPTWAAAEDTAPSIAPGTNFRIRASVQNTGTAAEQVLTLNIQRCGCTLSTFSTFSVTLNGADASSSADAAAVTVQRLTSGTGTFANGVYDENESLSLTLTNGFFTEVETGVVMTGSSSVASVGGGESWHAEYTGLTNAPDNPIIWTTPEQTGSDFQPGNQLGGAAQAVANSASISMTTAAAASAGNLVVVAIACDNAGSADGNNSDISGVTIGGVAATKAVEYSNGQGGAQAGTTASIWYLQLSGDLSVGSTITATFTTASTSGDANAIMAREFVVAAGKTVSVEATNGNATDGAVATTALDCTTSNIECLRVCANAQEGDATQLFYQAQTLFKNSKWSPFQRSGALARGVAGCSLWTVATITTGTGEQSQITTSSGNVDWASAYVAFKAVSNVDRKISSMFNVFDGMH